VHLLLEAGARRAPRRAQPGLRAGRASHALQPAAAAGRRRRRRPPPPPPPPPSAIEHARNSPTSREHTVPT